MKIGLIGNQITIIFLMILIGLYSRKKNIINDDINKGLSSLLLNVTLPLYIISAFNLEYSDKLFINALLVFTFGMLIHPFCYLIGKLCFFRYRSEDKNIMIFCVIFSNCGFMAFPILDGLYGKIGVLYGSAFLAPFNIYLWTLGIKLYKNEKVSSSLMNILNPGIIAVIIGMLTFLISIKLPFAVSSTCEIVGSMTTPISMIITGVSLAGIRLPELISSLELYYLSIIRLFIIPVTSLVLLRIIGVDSTVTGVCVLIAGMPTAAMAAVFAEQFRKDKITSSKAIFMTTLLSLFTLPLLMVVLS